MTEGYLAGIPQQQVECNGQHGIDADKHQHVHQVSALEGQRRHKDQQAKRSEI